MKQTIKVTRDENGKLQPSNFVSSSTPLVNVRKDKDGCLVEAEAVINHRGGQAMARRAEKRSGR